MNVKDIVKAYLEANGFTGLYNPYDPCGCDIDDLMPCDSAAPACQPGHRCTEATDLCVHAKGECHLVAEDWEHGICHYKREVRE